MQKKLFATPTPQKKPQQPPKPKPQKVAQVTTNERGVRQDRSIFTAEELPIAELIERRRRQLIVHSCLYYELDTNLISDKQFDEWGRELVKLQAEHKSISERVVLYEYFKDWDASTGYHLPTREPWVMRKAYQLKGGK